VKFVILLRLLITTHIIVKLKKKSEALEFKEFKASAENESEMKIKALRAERGGEYLTNEFQYFLKEYGIRSEFTAAYLSTECSIRASKLCW